MDSFATIEGKHESIADRGNGSQYLLLNKCADYYILLEALTGDALIRDGLHTSVEARLEGPHMKYFYQNMERVQGKNWWVFDGVRDYFDSAGWSSLPGLLEQQGISERLAFFRRNPQDGF